MPELNVDNTEIGLIMMGLSSIEDAQLTEDDSDPEALGGRMAERLRAAGGADILARAEEMGTG